METKKRKREDDQSTRITFKLASQPTQNIGPVLASFPSFAPTPSTSFKCYDTGGNQGRDTEEDEFENRSMIIAGEAETVEFSTADETEQIASSGCKYVIGVYNRQTQTCTLRPAPLHILTHVVKPLKSIKANEVSILPRMEARAELGGTFGTKKSKAAIRAAERNKVDVNAMEGVVGYLQERIEDGTENLPTQEEAKEAADAGRLIPKYDPVAEDPEDIYPLHNIISEAELKAISTTEILAAESDQARKKHLAYSRSNWISQHLTQALEEKPVNRKNLKILYYISAMMAFRAATAHKPIDVEKLNQKMEKVPTLISKGLLSKFVETTRDQKTLQVTSATETSLLTHMLALCLRIDQFATDPIVLAHDLSLPPTRLTQLFKSLGCKMEALRDKELRRLGLPDSAGETKRAILRAPVEFPKQRMKRKAK